MNAASVDKEINLAMMPVQMSRKSKHTDQFHENFSYNMDSFSKKRDLKAETMMMPRVLETTNHFFQHDTDKEMSRMAFPLR